MHCSESDQEIKKFKMAPATFYNHLISQSRANYHCSYANEMVSDMIKAGCFEEAVKCNTKIQSKAFDRVDNQVLATVLETAGFKPESCRWISMMYHNPQAVVQVNGRHSGAFTIGPAGLLSISSSVCPRVGAPPPQA